MNTQSWEESLRKIRIHNLTRELIRLGVPATFAEYKTADNLESIDFKIPIYGKDFYIQVPVVEASKKDVRWVADFIIKKLYQDELFTALEVLSR